MAMTASLTANLTGALSVLLITADDLRTQLAGAYGLGQTKTPNLDMKGEGWPRPRRSVVLEDMCGPPRLRVVTAVPVCPCGPVSVQFSSSVQ